MRVVWANRRAVYFTPSLAAEGQEALRTADLELGFTFSANGERCGRDNRFFHMRARGMHRDGEEAGALGLKLR
jgi:hypothetical protein